MGIPTSAPRSFFAGDTVKWTVSAPDYLPSDGWSLDVNLTNSAENHNVTSTDNSDGLHLVTFSAALTAAITAGDYRLSIAAVKSGERYTIETSSVTVRPNLTSAADARTHVKKTLDAIEAYLEDPNNLRAAAYSISGRSLNRIPMTEVIALHSRYRKLWRDEKNADRINSGQKPRRRLLTRMAG